MKKKVLHFILFLIISCFPQIVFGQASGGIIHRPTHRPTTTNTAKPPRRNNPTKPTATAPSVQTITVNGVSFKMVQVEGGTFQMGSTSGYDDEKPVHEVKVSSFSIGQTEVTQELWEAVMSTNPSYFKGNNRPVECVSWDDCQTFISKLNQLTGKTFRLPTEAEWEFAARGGNKSKGYGYSGSNTLDEVCWFWENSGDSRLSGEWDYDKITANNCCTHAVATKAPNELGIYDMSGNVWEWCQDWYSDNYYSESLVNNSKGPSSGSYRVVRGGSWFNNASVCRVAARSYDSPTNTNNDLGLRLAL